MTLAQFLKMLDLYGADLNRWPGAKRAEAARLVDRSLEARRAFEEARSLDHLLDLIDEPVGADQIERSLAAAIARTSRPRPALRPTFAESLAHWWPRAAALATAAVVGFVVGSAMLDWRDRASSPGLAGGSFYAAPIIAFAS